MTRLFRTLAAAVLALAGLAAAAPAGAAVAGTPWTVQATPPPPDGNGGTLSGISCPSADSCNAVGLTGNGQDMADHWNGTAWTVQVLQDLQAEGLSAVSCGSDTSCFAVGLDLNGPVGGSRAQIDYWNGTDWTNEGGVDPTDYGAEFSGVSCPSPADCTAVGDYQTKSSYLPLIEHWDGSSWTQQSGAPLQRPEGELTGISCLSATWCVAVGSSASGSNPDGFPLAESWNGKTWTLRKALNPSGVYGGTLNSVSCLSATACTAVGQKVIVNDAVRALAEHWNGTTWTVQTMQVTGSGAALNGVSCPSAASCTAVGYRTPSGSSHSLTLAEHWNGHGWTEQTTVSPGVAVNELASVACTATGCRAVGWDSNSTKPTATGQTLAESN